MAPKRTVFLVEDDRSVGKSLRCLFESVGLTVKRFESGPEFLAEVDPTDPGCLVLDVRLPGMNGLDLMSRLREEGVFLPVIILTGHGDVPMAVTALKGGAVDFIEKPFKRQAFLDSVHRAIELDVRLRAERTARAGVERRVGRLTPREREVMGLVVTGRPNREIAVELGCSVKTIEVHRSRVMEKMEAGSVAELVKLALGVGDERVTARA